MVSLTEENYLKTLFHLADKNEEVNVKDLSEVLSLKMPTVTSMMKKFVEKELVHYESYKPLKLTEIGKRAAGQVIRKHRLTECTW
jgi:DtxR family Mn-dependent transcriptional regulator